MLDRDKDFGECGSNSYGWKYYQDGKYFNGRGEELDSKGNSVTEASLEVVTAPPEGLNTKAIPKPRGRRKVAAIAPSGAKK